MVRLWHSPLALLLLTGTLLGLGPPLGKFGLAAGVPALAWTFLISAGAGALLAAGLLARGRFPALDGERIVFAMVAATLSYAIPNGLMFAAIPHVGAGYAGIMLTLSPVFTLTMALVFGVRRPNALGIAGIAVGFVGAVIVAASRGEVGRPAEPLWVAAGLAVPLFLASGNIYRTVAWPKGAGPVELAALSHLASAGLLLAAMVVTGEVGGLSALGAVPVAAALQVAVSTAMFALFFRLQAVGGPVYLSQIGYVGAAVGLLGGLAIHGSAMPRRPSSARR